MTYLAADERTGLCDDALEVGEDAPTLCGDWTVKDLIVHLIVRESGNPAAVGIVVPQLAGLTDFASSRIGRDDFEKLVERLRQGPPVYSPFALRKVDAMFNAMEYFIHHEDIRRAQPTWSPRPLSAKSQNVLWRAVRSGGRGLVRNAPTGVVVERADTGEQVDLKSGSPVVVRGLPGEVALFVYGRTAQAEVTLLGDPADVDLLRSSSLGV